MTLIDILMLATLLLYLYDVQTDGKLDLPHLSITAQFKLISDLVNKLADKLKRKINATLHV